MNTIQSYQTVFNGYANIKIKPIKTLADKMKQEKALNNRILSLSEKYKCSPEIIKQTFRINGKTSVSQLNAEVSRFEKVFKEAIQEVKKDFKKENTELTIDNVNIIITK